MRSINGAARNQQTFDGSASVSELYSYVKTQAGENNFILKAGFPPRPIEEAKMGMSIEDAKLTGERIIVVKQA